MAEHRVRLDDRELDLVVAALRARRSGLSAGTAAEVAALATRLAERTPGNPVWIHGNWPAAADRQVE